MRYKNIFAAIAFVAVFFAGWISHYYYTGEAPVVAPGKIRWKSGTVKKNVRRQPRTALEKELECYYTAEPRLNIEQTGKNEIVAKAGLCERAWTRKARIHPRRPKHILSAGLGYYFSGEFAPGIDAAYYLNFDGFALGGGVLVSRQFAGVRAGVLFMF